MKKFANRLRELRKKNGLSQDDLAKALGTSRSTIGNYEQGLREPQDHETLEAIADFFNVDIDYLIGRKDWITSIKSPDMIMYEQMYNDWAIEEKYVFNQKFGVNITDVIIEVLQDKELSKRLESYAEKLLELKRMEEE